MSKKLKVYVVPTEQGFGVKIAGNSRNSKNFNTKEKAIVYGKKRAKALQTELVIQNKDGKISEANSYGNDPRRTKG